MADHLLQLRITSACVDEKRSASRPRTVRADGSTGLSEKKYVLRKITIVACILLCYYPFEMTTPLYLIAVLLGLAIALGSYFSRQFLKLGKEFNHHMATSAQALQDLQQVVTDLGTTVQSAVTELTTLLNDIIAANGVQPAQVEASVAQARALLNNLNTAIAAAQAATAPPVAAVVVSVSPATSTLAPGGTTQFSASVTGGASGGDASVKWSAQSGSIDANGNYTSPAADGTDVVTATSNQDPTKTATAAVTIAG